MTQPVRLAIIGAGIFARDAHVPALLALGDQVEIVAIWSRTTANAAALAASIGKQTGGTPDVEVDLDTLLARADVEAVDIVLPIDSQPAVLRKAWRAGKHVISEKPIAPTVEEARSMIAEWRQTGVNWSIAENWRYESAFVAAREVMAQGAIGKIISVSWAVHSPATPDNAYFHTGWRREGGFPGGYLLDAGVHRTALIRAVAGEVKAVQAFVAHNNPDLPPSDTVAATLHFENGALGTYLSSHADTPRVLPPLQVVGDAGILRVDRGFVEIERPGGVERREFPAGDGVQRELAAFFTALRGGTPHLNTPEEAFGDLAIIEAMLKSGVTGKVESVDYRYP